MRYVNASRPHTHTTITIRPQASVIHPSKRRPSREDVAVTKCEPCTSPLLSSFRFGAEICERLLLPLLLLAHYFFITWFIPTERTRPWDFARKHSVRLHPFNIRDGCHPHAPHRTARRPKRTPARSVQRSFRTLTTRVGLSPNIPKSTHRVPPERARQKKVR